jgi:sRNA-binding protein
MYAPHQHCHRDERDDHIAYLATQLPKCFFVKPENRQPLKRNIIDDLGQRKLLNHGALVQVVRWYESYWTYQYGLVAGAKRIDLDGVEVGTVTPAEEREAKARTHSEKLKKAEREAASYRPRAVELLPAINRPQTGAAPVIKEVPAPTSAANDRAAALGLPPPLAPLHEAPGAVAGILTDPRYEAPRPVLAAAALRALIGGAEKLIGELRQGEG